ncbi:NADH dehydrogenase [ubiquinone] 1 alpha subcomplex subunit 7-like [Lycorma delicatula]|uniref:NADH dehydrogenase [ubiquinone] 1 alpha subcomplex subunit 7-like n=1 Tax=Lycorma delicatula TaxID=130591 RepID=UPI003F51A05B
MAKVAPRSVSPIIAKIRDFLLARKSVDHNRFADNLAPRTQPPPNLPDGSAHKLSDNYYYIRDVRREVKPSLLLAENTKIKKIGPSSAANKVLPPTECVPGQVYNY